MAYTVQCVVLKYYCIILGSQWKESNMELHVSA